MHNFVSLWWSLQLPWAEGTATSAPTKSPTRAIPLDLSMFYPWGVPYNDTRVAYCDDACETPYNLPGSFSFFGSAYTRLHVNNNGIMNFVNLPNDGTVSSYTPTPMPIADYPAVCVFWADVDTRGQYSYNGGYTSPDPFIDATAYNGVWSQLYYCPNRTKGGTAAVCDMAQADVRSRSNNFPDIESFVPNWVLVATWMLVDKYSYAKIASPFTVCNTFQAVLIQGLNTNTGNPHSFATYMYPPNSVNWLYGSASGGISAQVGFDAGDKTNYYTVNGSRTTAIKAALDGKKLFFETGNPAISAGLPPPPVIWQVYPQGVQSNGGVNITMIGYNFGTTPTVTVGPSPCPLLYANNTILVCVLPPGQGAPAVSVLASTRFQQQLPMWNTDMSFRSTITSTGQWDTSSARCVNLPHPSSAYWNDNYMCGLLSKANLQQVWSTNGPVAGMNCENILNSNSTTWGTNTYYCLPASAPYNLTYSQNGPIPGLSCINFGDVSDPVWSANTYYLCTNYMGPYGSAAILTYQYMPPTITSVYPQTGPTAGGTIVTIQGISFGNLGNGQVFFDTVNCPVSGSYNSTTVYCTVPAGEGNHTITIQVGGLTSNRNFFFSYSPPSITSWTPLNPYTSPVVDTERLTITGINFGANSAFVTIGGIACTPQSWSATSIICTQNGVGTLQPLVVKNYYGQQDDASPSNTISFLPPQFASVTPISPTSATTQGGAVLTITGRNFGITGAATVGGAPCPLTGTGYTQSQILCSLPAGQGSNLSVVVTVAGQTATLAGVFSYQPPTIFAVNPSTGSVGTQLVITGASFGLQGNITINGVRTTCSSWTHTQLICAAPASTGANVAVIVSSASLQSNTNVAFTYRPIFTSIAPVTMATDANTSLSITGLGFDSTTVLMHRVMLTSTNFTFLNSTYIVYPNPTGEGTISISGSTSGITASTTLSFTYQPPVITGVNPPNGSSSGNTNLTITGNNFGRPTALISVSVGENPAVVLSHDHHTIVLQTPAGVGVGRNVIVTVGGQISNSGSFDYNPPRIDTVTPNHASTAGGVTVTLTGDGFGSGGTVYVGSMQASTASVSNGGTVATFILPGNSGSQAITIRPVGNSISNAVQFTYDPPTVINVSPSLGPTTGGNVITIVGSSLSVNPAVAVGSSVCQLLTSNDTCLTCSVPAGQGYTNVVVSASGRSIQSPVQYQYAPPVISTITPTTAATSGGIQLALTGLNFGLSGSVMVGPNVCSTADSSALWSHTLIKCILPSGQNSSLAVTVLVASQQAQSPQQFSYLPPQINAVTYSSGTATTATTVGGTVLFLTGSNFGFSAVVTLQGLGRCVPTQLVQTNSELECVAPPGQGIGIPLIMTVGNQNNSAQASPATVVYSPPVFTGGSPVLFPISANMTMVLNGTNLGLNSSIVITLSAPSKGNVIPVNLGLNANQNQLSFIVPPGAGMNWKVSVSIANQQATFPGSAPSFSFAYNPPSITSVSGCPTPVGQGTSACPVGTTTTLVLTGTNFGTTLSLVSVQIGTGSTAQNCPLTSISDSSLQCTLQSRPAGGFNLPVQVTVDSQVSTSVPLVSYAGPTITSGTLSLSPGSPNGTPSLITASSGSSVTFSGMDWTTRGTSSDAVVVRVGANGTSFTQKPLYCTKPTGQAANTFVSTTSGGVSTVTCTLPTGSVGQNLVFQIQSGQQTSLEGNDRVSFPPPSIVDGSIRVGSASITGASRAQGTLNSGDTVFFNVLNSGTDPTLLTVLYGQNGVMSKQCLGVNLTGSTLSCVTTEGFGTSYQFQITALNYAGPIGNVYYDYPSVPTVVSVRGCPVVSGNNTLNCPTVGGVTLQVLGTGFSTTNTRVRVGGQVCGNLVVTDSQHLNCTLPQGAGDPASIDVAVVALVSTPYPLVHYAAASVITLSSTDCTASGNDIVNCPRNAMDVTGTVHSRLTITGTNFGPPTARVLVGGVECLNLAHDSTTPDSRLYCDLPQGTRNLQYIYLFQHNGLLTASNRSVSFAQCAPGSSAANDVITCTLCNPGTFTNAFGSVVCKSCSSGQYANNSGSSACVNCPRGNYSVATGSAGPSSCSACQPGSYSDLIGLQECILCPGGKFAAQISSQSCQLCAPGSYQTLPGQSFCTACDPGNYAPSSGAQSCGSCTGGTRSMPSGGGGTSCDTCPAGTYGPDRSNCVACELGKASSGIGRVSCSTCGAGYFSNQTASLQCQMCRPGSASTPDINGNGATVCSQCSPGWYMPSSGQAACIQCPVGSFTNSTGSSFCQQCFPGSFAGQPGATTCSNCNAGAFASGFGAAQCFPCGLGTYNDDVGHLDCKQCPVGMYQPSTGQTVCANCTAGTANSALGQPICLPCQSGTYSEYGGAFVCTKCPLGSFSTASLTSVYIGPTYCMDCAAGFYASTTGSAQCDPCPIGYMSNTTGSEVCDPCEPGTAIEFSGQSTCRDCAPGRYSPTPGVVTCITCDRGTSQPLSAQSTCDACTAGSYQQQSGASVCETCSPGAFSVNGAAECSSCPPGSFSSNASSLSCTPCPAGQFQSRAGATTCQACDQGRYTQLLGQISCVPCGPGSFSIGTGNVKCTTCGVGTYQPHSSASSCSNCTAGSMAALPGMGVCTQCPAGSYQDQNAQTSCILCPPGSSQLLLGQQTCDLCPAGTAVNAYGATNCVPCDGGYFATTNGQVTCAKCPAGSFSARVQGSDTGPTACELCVPTTFVSSPGQPSCWDCPAGSYGVTSGLTECTSCPPGTFQSAPRSKECTECPVGKYTSSYGAVVCQDCIAGSISNATAASTCFQCPIGTAANVNGLTACATCNPGYYAGSPGSIRCAPCPSGSAGNATGGGTCHMCAAGSAQPREGQLNCLPCPVGQHAPLPGAENCLSCLPGTAASTTGTTMCQVCEAGYFSLEHGAVNCTQCQPGRSSTAPGSNICAFCEVGRFSTQGSIGCQDCSSGSYQNSPAESFCLPCPAGTYAGAASSACMNCPEGQIAPTNNSASCLACQEWSATNPAKTACVCQPGYAFYVDQNNLTSCRQCPVGAKCDGFGTVYSKMETLPGYWEENMHFYRCLLDDDCVGGASSPCAPNKFGPLCAQCQKGYTQDITNKCVKCVNRRRSIGFVIIVTMAIVIALIIQYAIVLKAGNIRNYVAQDRHALQERDDSQMSVSQPNRGALKPVAMSLTNLPKSNPETVAAVALKRKARGETTPKTYPPRSRYMGALTIFGAPNPPPNFTFKLKIALGFAQIITNLVIGLTVQWPSSFKKFIAFFNIANFDFFQGAQFGCVVDSSYFTKLWVAIIFPPVLILLLFIFYLLPNYIWITCCSRRVEDTKAARKQVRQLFWRLTIFTLFLVYPAVSTIVLRAYVCRTVEGMPYLQADFSITCQSARWHWHAVRAAVFAVVYPVGIPLFFFIMLFRYRKRLDEPAVRMELGILYDAYERDVWWFEMVDMGHKLTICCIIAFIPADWQMIAGMIIVTAYLAVIWCFRPYIRKADDRLQLYALCILVCILLAGYVLDNYIVPDIIMEVVMTIVLIAAFVLFFLYLIVTTLHTVRKYCARRRAIKAAASGASTTVAPNPAGRKHIKFPPGQEFYPSLIVLNAARKQDMRRGPDEDSSQLPSRVGQPSQSISGAPGQRPHWFPWEGPSARPNASVVGGSAPASRVVDLDYDDDSDPGTPVTALYD